MKLLVFLFLVGCASAASFYDALDDAAEHELMPSLDYGLYLKENLELVDDQLYSDEERNEVFEEIKKRVKEALEKFLEKLKERIGGGDGSFNDKLKEQIDKFVEKLKTFKVQVGEKIIKILEEIREKVPEKYKEFFDKIIKKLKDIKEEKEFNEVQHDFNLKPLCQKLKDAIDQHFDKDKIKQKIEEIFKKDSLIAKALLSFIDKHEKRGQEWKQKIVEMLKRCIGEDKRSIKDYWEKVKNYFKDLQIDLKEKYMKFGEWVKNQLEKGLEKGKDKLENIKAIAKEFIKHVKDVNDDVSEQAKDFFKQYKEELGKVWEELKDAFKKTGKNIE